MSSQSEPSRESWPLVSVLTRTFNRRELLREAVRSVADQHYPNIEYVVVNDGGESVADILEPYRDRLAVVYLEPGRVGRCAAGNRAMAAASGRYFAHLDDDDLYEPWHLDVLVEALESGSHKVVYSDAWQLDMSRSGPEGAWEEQSRSIPYSEDFDRLRLFEKAYIHIVTLAHHREVYERLGGFDESLEVLEDWDLLFRWSQDYDFLHIPRPTCAFRVRNDGSNAISAERKEFVETRSRLLSKYAHVALRETLGLLRSGQAALGGLEERVRLLEEEVRHLRGGSP